MVALKIVIEGNKTVVLSKLIITKVGHDKVPVDYIK